ncbi:MAG: dTMP kinase [Treponema sp.]|nr:dTMP kinase [Treponema sp.]MCL2236736.1 dTMP kinase [Treponema sp.]
MNDKRVIIPNFLVFEGGDGSGTTTQLNMLGDRLKKLEKPIFLSTFEPTDGQIGKIIRSALKKESEIKPETLAFLFAADRNEHLYAQNGILAHVNKGEMVICDRYVLSSLVYQGIECADELPQLLNSGFGIPEMTVFLDIDPEIALERMKDRASLEIYEYREFQEKVREKYKTAIREYRAQGARVETVDASKSAQEVFDMVWSIVSQMPILKHNENNS